FSRIECIQCHDAHGTNNPVMSQTRLTELCYTCHKKEEKEYFKTYIHTPVNKKQCGSCH
ncbi:hypothetical protein GTO27_02315, partial [Candidatus Bathyarchaeota archaeon]|nr:hypothetical protein [Candidatus Bathyarchaeota archaeon]